MAAPQDASSLMKAIPTVSTEDPATKPVQHLMEYGVAVLLDKHSLPIGILSLSDIETVMTLVSKASKDKVPQAEALYSRRGPSAVSTVREHDSVSDVASSILRNKQHGGVTVVDERGHYLGYVFASEVGERLRSSSESLYSEVLAHAELLKKQYPNASSQIARLLEPS